METIGPISVAPPFAEDRLLPISALQHLLYCERQCALIHIERVWVENRFTAEGRVLHQRTHERETTFEHGVRVARAVPLRSLRLGLTGVSDVVEFRNGLPVPVEYKRGRPKLHRADEVQLCAQALCLEEMLSVSIPEADLFYGEPRRRQSVRLDTDLRLLTEVSALRLHALIASGKTPPAEFDKAKCCDCSLLELCQPRLRAGSTVSEYLAEMLEPPA